MAIDFIFSAQNIELWEDFGCSQVQMVEEVSKHRPLGLEAATLLAMYENSRQ